MSQLTNNHEGSFDFPPGLANPSDPPITQPSSPKPVDDTHNEVISQAKRDRDKAEELIASLSENSEENSTFISLANDDEQLRPGDFAAADPYVNTGENSTDNTINADKNEAMENETGPNGMVETVGASGASELPPPISTATPQDKQGGITNLSTPQEVGAEQSAEKGVRTVEEILSKIPGYEAEQETVTAPASSPSVEITQAASAAVDQPEETSGSAGDQASEPAQGATSQSPSQPCSSPVNCDGEALAPVSWFAQAEAEETAADGLGVESVATGSPSDSAGVNFVSTSVDPVSGEEQFDVRDFSEMADAKPQLIPNALKDGNDGSETSAGDTPAEAGLASSTAAADSAQSDKQPRVTTVMPVSSPLSFSAAATAGAGLAAAGAGAGLLASSLATPGSDSATTDVSASDVASQPTNASGSLAGGEEASNANPLSKKAPPAPTIDDFEIAAALEKCAEIPEPTLDCGVAKFLEESFDEPEVPVAVSEETTEAAVTEEATQADDDTFLVDGGDVIQIDGNDGYDFIDLACFERNSAEIKQDRIIVQDEENPAFEVHYKNVEYALFAYGVKVELPLQAG